MDIEELRRHLTARLNDSGAGKVLCNIEVDSNNTSTDEQRIATHLAKHFGIAIDSNLLKPMRPEIARKIAEKVAEGLCFPSNSPDADHLKALHFLGHFSDRSRFYSTYEYELGPQPGNYLASGRSLTGNTVDEGVCVVDETKLGLLWMGDED